MGARSDQTEKTSGLPGMKGALCESLDRTGGRDHGAAALGTALAATRSGLSPWSTSRPPGRELEALLTSWLTA